MHDATRVADSHAACRCGACPHRQFQVERSLPSLEARVTALEAQRDAVEVEDEAQVCAWRRW